MVHRVAYVGFVRALMSGEVVHHRKEVCPNRNCVNHKHLEAMTNAQHQEKHPGVPQ